MDAKEALEMRRKQILDRLTSENLQIQPGYFNVREEILRPDRLESETAYFWDQWSPRLGASAVMLIVRMRQACRRAGNRPDEDAAVTLSYQEIARFCGMSASTIKRLLQQDDVRRFIRKEAQMRESAIGMVDAPNRYVVMMTDPLIPEDEERLRGRLVDRMLTQELLRRDSAASSRPAPAAIPPLQNDPASGVRNDPKPRAQNDLAAGDRNEPASDARFSPAPVKVKASVLTSRGRADKSPVRDAEAKTSAQNVKEQLERNVNNVNDNDPYIKNDLVEEWAQRMVEATNDDKSLNFYRKTARILLQRKAEGVMDHALGLVKEAIREGKARKPAALLTSSLLSLAEERGIFITDRDRKEASQVRNLVRDALGG